MVRVKICGITSAEDAITAVEAGADAIGLVFYEKSPRHISTGQASEIVRIIPPFIQVVGLFVNAEVGTVNATADLCRLDLVQLHGDETPEYCSQVNRRVIKAFRIKGDGIPETMKDYQVNGNLLDAWSPLAYGGTGSVFNWNTAREAKKFGCLILAGGLTSDNVLSAIEIVKPYAVDVSSGVESNPGRKDPDKIRDFIKIAKGW